MKTKLAKGRTWHARKEPVEHSFAYPLYGYCLDLDDFDQDSKGVRNHLWPLFAYNSSAVASIRDADYLYRGSESLREKVHRVLSERGIEERPERIELLTSARYFGYVFNPASFYYCYGADGSTLAYIVEIHNTFGDTHVYVLPEGELPSRRTRVFHVSPFNDLGGEYVFKFTTSESARRVEITIVRENKSTFVAGITVKLEPLTRRSLGATLLRRPFQAWWTMPRILWHAGILYYRRRLGVYTRPTPVSEDTIRVTGPTLQQRMARYFVRKVLRRLEHGTLVFELPDGTTEVIRGRRSPGERHRLRIHNYRIFSRLALSGDIGAGEGFVSADWSSEDLVGLMQFLVKNQELVDFRKTPFSFVGKAVNRLFHVRRRNDPEGSRKNISEHYDLSNEFFALFLDSSMTYSSALYRSEQDSLEEAQINKLRSMIAKAQICESDHVLEIGCGWGSFALQAVRETGCRVTCLTLSERQKEYAEVRIADAGLSERITVLLQDYRHLQGSFDKIVSIEMAEAIGHEFLDTYFASCARLLKPEGLMVAQIITLPEARISRYRKGVDWIQKHIFPGCYCPSVEDLVRAAGSSGLTLESTSNYAPHYARTLREWRQSFLEKQEEVRALGFDDRFLRAWEYYLAYCEAGFASRSTGVHQLVLSRQHNLSLGVETSAEDFTSMAQGKSSCVQLQG